MGNPETVIKNKGLCELSKIGKFWNHPTGTAVPKDVAMKPCRRCGTRPIIHSFISYGCVGSADVIGAIPITITPDMVGKTIGVATYVEFKTATGTQSEWQKDFQTASERVGAVYMIERDHKGICARVIARVMATIKGAL